MRLIRKGFTLIELLAVIVILAIIALIALPIIIGLIDDARKESFKNSAYGIVGAGEILFSKDLLKRTTEVVTFTYTDGVEKSSVIGKKLDYNGSKPNNGKVKVNAEGQVAIAIHNGTYCAKKGYSEDEINLIEESFGDCILPLTCRRATTRHIEICTYADANYYCSGTGYTTEGTKKTTTIEYGSLGTSEVLTSGDAFDCDVNGDGIYDKDTERFYYVSYLYNTTTKTFDDTIAVLIYYTNTTTGEPDNTTASLKAYNSDNYNYVGPTTAILNLSTTSQWTNIELKRNSRQILTKTGTTTIGEHILPSFDYSGYAARLITSQEIAEGCGEGIFTTGGLDNCNYLMENTKYSSSDRGTYGFWLETPTAVNASNVSTVNGYGRLVSFSNANFTGSIGVRPAIEVLTSDISY